MSENKSSGNLNLHWLAFELMVLAGILGWFEYRSIDGVLSMIALDISLGLFGFIALVPVIGLLVWIGVSWYYLIPKILAYTQIGMSWVVKLIFVWNLISAIIITLVVIILLIMLVSS